METSTDELFFSVDENQLSLEVDESIYPIDAIYGAAYLFVDRCYLFMSRPGDKKILLRFRGKKPLDKDGLEQLAGEFSNELLNQILRFRISESTSKIREYYMARAFASHPAQQSIDSLLAELDAEELEEDDLEISVPWEQKDG